MPCGVHDVLLCDPKLNHGLNSTCKCGIGHSATGSLKRRSVACFKGVWFIFIPVAYIKR